MRGKKLKMELIINVVIKTKLFKTKTKTWPLPTNLTQRLKDRDTNTIIPNLYPAT